MKPSIPVFIVCRSVLLNQFGIAHTLDQRLEHYGALARSVHFFFLNDDAVVMQQVCDLLHNDGIVIGMAVVYTCLLWCSIQAYTV